MARVILGCLFEAVLIVLLAQPSAPPTWDSRWFAFGLLIGAPGQVPALAAREIGQRKGTAQATTRGREPRRWAEDTG